MTSPAGFHRRIVLRSPSGTEVTAELEDDFHHFRVWIGHDGERVVTVGAEALRYPWSTCPQAKAELLALTGAPLTADTAALAALVPPRRNCTHMHDLAGLAVAHAARGRDHRRYDAVVPDRDPEGRTRAVLWRDGAEVLAWDLHRHRIAGPPPWSGRDLRAGFVAWAGANLDPDDAEAACVLRRAAAIALGRMVDLDAYERADELREVMLGACYTFSPAVIATARRVRSNRAGPPSGR